MKKIMLGVLLCLLSMGQMQSQEMKEVFINMPDSLAGLLTKVNRADCVDFLASDMKAQVTNRYNRQSELTRLTPDYLHLQVSPEASWQMKLLPLADSTKVVCWVRTVNAPVSDSQIDFYTTDWQLLDKNEFIAPPVADDFFILPDAPATTSDSRLLLETANQSYPDSLATLRLEADLTFMKIILNPEEDSLTFTYTTPDYVRKETAERLLKYIRNISLPYTWKKGRFARKSE